MFIFATNTLAVWDLPVRNEISQLSQKIKIRRNNNRLSILGVSQKDRQIVILIDMMFNEPCQSSNCPASMANNVNKPHYITMRIRPFVTLLLSATLTACISAPEQTTQNESAPAPTPTPAPTTEIASDKTIKVRKICKYITPTGSRIGHKICHTKKGWDQMEANAREAVESAGRPQFNPED